MSNYSFETSLPPYREEPGLKRKQADKLLTFINRGANNLLQLSQLSGLPQSTVAGRCNDLKMEGKIDYSGFVVYENRKRKKIVARPVIKEPQTLFDEPKKIIEQKLF